MGGARPDHAAANRSQLDAIERGKHSMKLDSVTAFLALFVVFALGSAAQEPRKTLGDAVGREPRAIVEKVVEDPNLPPIEATMQSLSLRERVAQLMFVTMRGRFGPDSDGRRLLRDLSPGGVLIPDIARPGDSAQYVAALRGAPMEVHKKIPMFIATNAYSLTQHHSQRGAKFIQMPSPLALAAANDPASTERLTNLVARYLDTMGFNMHMGPSLALAPDLTGAEATVLTFGSDPGLAGETGAAFYRALMGHNIQGVPMGFPGGGANRLRGGAAVLLTPRGLLAERELAPYRLAIEEGVRFMHVGNTLLAPTIDRTSGPASTSPIVMQDLLRRELGFDGIVIAGPMDSPDLGGIYGHAAAAIRALRAGADMIYWGQSGARVAQGALAIARAVADDSLDEGIIDAALKRVLTVKEELGLLDRAPPDVKDAKKLEKEKAKSDAAYLVERRAMTLVQNRGGILPLTGGRSAPIGVTGVVGVDELQDALEERIERVAKEEMINARHVSRLESFEIKRITRKIAGIRTMVCVLDNSIEPAGQARLVRELQDEGVRVVVVLLGYPKLLPQLRHADALVLAYSRSFSASQTMRAAADILLGNAPVAVLEARQELRLAVNEEMTFDVLDVIRSPVGKLPVTIDETFPAGMSVRYNPVMALDKVQWDFGDGARSRDHSIAHAFRKPGRYPVTISITNARGDLSAGTYHVVVE